MMKTLEDCVDAALTGLTQKVRTEFARDPKTVLRDGLGVR